MGTRQNGAQRNRFRSLWFARRFWARLVLLCLLGNLALPGLAQAWVASSADHDQTLIAVCTANGIRMVSIGPGDEPAAQSDSRPALPDQPGAGNSHCQACLGNGPDGLPFRSILTAALAPDAGAALVNSGTGIMPGAPVSPGAPARAPPTPAD